MSNKYKHGDRVPNDILANRLGELATAVTKGKEAVNREFMMRVPAELDHDADLVLSQAADRLRKLEIKIGKFTISTDNEPGFIIYHTSGEAGRFKEKALEKALNDFFEREF